ncbi:MAG: flagellar basal body protein [Proteobacteria bacterium]|nr:MAG: flagellar basal body protein [Pseudomonadota bacterium]
MKRQRFIAGIALVTALGLAAGGVITWWLLEGRAQGVAHAAGTDVSAYRYLGLDKVIVMLRNEEGQSVPHYMVVDLVFKTPPKQEKITREHLPLLRSVAVNALSRFTRETATRMSVEELAAEINAAYEHTYAQDRHGKPFAEALIGRLIIE